MLPAYSVGHLIGFIGYTIITDLYFFRPAGIRCTSHFRLQMVDTRIVFWGTVQPDIIVSINNVLIANRPAWYFPVRDHACALGEVQQRHRKSKCRVNKCVCAEVSGNTGRVVRFE